VIQWCEFQVVVGWYDVFVLCFVLAMNSSWAAAKNTIHNVDHYVLVFRVQLLTASHRARRNLEPLRQYSAKLEALPVRDITLQVPWKRAGFLHTGID